MMLPADGSAEAEAQAGAVGWISPLVRATKFWPHPSRGVVKPLPRDNSLAEIDGYSRLMANIACTKLVFDVVELR